VIGNSVNSANDKRDHGDLDAEKNASDLGLFKIEPLIQPSDADDQEQARQHKCGASKQPAQPFSLHHPEMHTKLVRFRAGKHLIDREQPVEARWLDPPFLLDQFSLDHRNLRDWTAPRQEAEPKEPPEDRS